MLRHVALIRTDVSEELSALIIRMTRIGELGTMLAVTKQLTHLLANTIDASSYMHHQHKTLSSPKHLYTAYVRVYGHHQVLTLLC
jgi:hypothetical protein